MNLPHLQKLDARLRKRPMSAFADTKFDSAFISNAMSDDEDNPDGDPVSEKLFVSRAPDYRSEQASI